MICKLLCLFSQLIYSFTLLYYTVFTRLNKNKKTWHIISFFVLNKMWAQWWTHWISKSSLMEDSKTTKHCLNLSNNWHFWHTVDTTISAAIRCHAPTVGSLSPPTSILTPPSFRAMVRTLLLSLSATNMQLHGSSGAKARPEGWAKPALWG